MNLKMQPNIKVNKPNEKVELYDGMAIFTIGDSKFESSVKVFQSWFPTDRLMIEVKSITYFKEWEFKINIKNFYDGKVLVTSKSGFEEIDLEGQLSNPIKYTFSDEKVKSVRFSLFNFVNLNGYQIRDSEKEESYSAGEIIFVSDEAQLTLHDYVSVKDRENFKKSHGHGYLFTTVGQLNFTQSIEEEDVNYYTKRLHVFLSFLNGRRTSPRFIKCFDKDQKVVTQDYSNYKLDDYRYVLSWLPFVISNEVSFLWSNFLVLAKQEDDFEKISLIIHWYLEALNQSGYVDGSIILLQSSYETLFNWIFNEKNEILLPDSIEKLRASDKIRLLLDKYNISNELPEGYCKKYKRYIKDKKELKNFAYQFTEIRNLYVHYKKDKTKILKERPELFNYHLLNTGIYKLEMLILRILNYKGKITSRVSEDFWMGSNQVEI